MATGKDFYTGVSQPKIISKEALMTLSGDDLEQLLFPIFDSNIEKKSKIVTSGLPAGPGAAVGKLFSKLQVEKIVEKDVSKINFGKA